MMRIKSVWLCTVLVSTACSPFRFEGFENTSGLDQLYSDGATITAGNSFDPDADPADVGSPPTWGSQCARISIGAAPADGAALYRHRFAPGSTNGYYSALDVVVTENGLNEGEFISIAVVKPEGGPEDPVAAWALFIGKVANQTFFLWTVGDYDQLFRYPANGSIELGRRYVHAFMYDLACDRFGWAVDMTPVAYGAIEPTYFQNIGTIVIGSSSTSIGRATTYYVDNYFFGEVLDPAPRAEIQTFRSTQGWRNMIDPRP